MASEVWISEHDPEYIHVYRAHRYWKHNVGYGDPFEDWLERNYRCCVAKTADLGIPTLLFFSPADKTFFLLKWS